MKNERGIALVIVMLLLISMTVIGFLSIAMTTTNITIGGNKKLKKQNLHAGESVIEVSAPFIESAAYERAIPSDYSSLTFSSDVITEILGMHAPPEDTVDNPRNAPDVNFAVGGMNVIGDIDYLYATTVVGGALEFASGYEGVGKGLGQSGAIVFYRINSLAQGPINSSARVGAIYRYVTK